MKTYTIDQVTQEGLRIIEGYDEDYTIQETERIKLKQYMSDQYNNGLPISDELFQDLIQDKFDLQEIRAKVEYQTSNNEF